MSLPTHALLCQGSAMPASCKPSLVFLRLTVTVDLRVEGGWWLMGELDGMLILEILKTRFSSLGEQQRTLDRFWLGLITLNKCAASRTFFVQVFPMSRIPGDRRRELQ